MYDKNDYTAGNVSPRVSLRVSPCLATCVTPTLLDQYTCKHVRQYSQQDVTSSSIHSPNVAQGAGIVYDKNDYTADGTLADFIGAKLKVRPAALGMAYRGTTLIRERLPLDPYSRHMPTAS